MTDHDENHSEQNETELNPAPKSFRVPFSIKLSFIGVAIFGVALYFYAIKTKRQAEAHYLIEHHLAPSKPTLSAMPSLIAMDARSGKAVNLESFLGGFVLLNIWATWCPPCREEMPSLELLSQKLKGRLTVVALSVDENLDAVQEFLVTHQPSFAVLWDNVKQAPKQFGITKYPETFLINPQGQIVNQYSGPRDWSSPQTIDHLLQVAR